MENEIFEKNGKNGVFFSDKFFGSRKIYKFRSIYDTAKDNTIIIADIERATVFEAKEFHDYVNNLLDNNKSRLIIDLEKVYFMDSVFFGTLIKLLKKADKLNGYIKLIVDYKSKPELLSISNFDGIFEIFPNLFEAVNKEKAN